MCVRYHELPYDSPKSQRNFCHIFFLLSVLVRRTQSRSLLLGVKYSDKVFFLTLSEPQSVYFWKDVYVAADGVIRNLFFSWNILVLALREVATHIQNAVVFSSSLLSQMRRKTKLWLVDGGRRRRRWCSRFTVVTHSMHVWVLSKNNKNNLPKCQKCKKILRLALTLMCSTQRLWSKYWIWWCNVKLFVRFPFARSQACTCVRVCLLDGWQK